MEVVEEMVKVDLSHLLEQREEAGNVLPLRKNENQHQKPTLENHPSLCSSKRYRYLCGALGTALSPRRLHRVRLAHDGQQRL